jgi:glycosyltransferase involved in cell wall biosynthesis
MDSLNANSSESTPVTNTLRLVSVVIPAYDAAATVAATIRSVLEQTYTRLEIIVVDDGSTDNTAEVLVEFGSSIRVVHKTNGGLASARNAGCEAAGGEFIALLDADDLCTPQRIALQVKALESDPDVVLACSDFAAFTSQGPLQADFAARYYSAIGQSPHGIESFFPMAHYIASPSTTQPVLVRTGNLYPALALGNFVHPPTCMFRKSAFIAAGGFDTSVRNMCDWEWLVRVARLGKFAYLQQRLLHYRLSDAQLSGAKHRAQAMRDIVKVFEIIRQQNPDINAITQERFARELAQARIWAADAEAENSGYEALGYLVKALPQGFTQKLWFVTLAKCLLPAQLRCLTRALRRARTQIL